MNLEQEKNHFGKILNNAFDSFVSSQGISLDQILDRIQSDQGLEFSIADQNFEPDKAKYSRIWHQNLYNLSSALGDYVWMEYELHEQNGEQVYIFTIKADTS
jgi:hypothetical protein